MTHDHLANLFGLLEPDLEVNISAARTQGTFAVSMDGWKHLDLQWQQCFCWLIHFF